MPPDTSHFASRPIADRPQLPESAHWYVIYTKPCQEYRALKNLEQQALEVFLPLHQTAPQALFQRGETLRVTGGPFRDLQAVFEIQDGDHRAIVLIELLNKMQKISVNLNSLSKSE